MKANIWDGSLNIRQKDMVQNEFIGQFIQQKSFNTLKFISKEIIFIYCLQSSLDSISNTWILSCTHNSLVAELIWVQASQFRQFREKKYLNEPKKNCPTGAVSRFSSVGALVYWWLSSYSLLLWVSCYNSQPASTDVPMHDAEKSVSALVWNFP